MKKIKLFFALFAMLALGVGNAWAETATLTFSAKCDGKETDTQGYNWTITSDGTESTFDQTKGIHYGTSSAKVKYIRLSTSDIPGTITEVKVNASTASGVTANLTVKVGSSDFTTGNSVTSQQLSTSATEYTFSGSASGEIIVEISKSSSATKAIYCKSVVVTYETSGSTETVLTVEPKKVDFGTKNIYFESEKQGSLEIDITGQNLTGNVTATITEDDDNVFSLSSSSFAPNAGEVFDKLTVSYNVSEAKDYTATLTLSSDGVEDIELPITLKVINEEPATYVKVTNAVTDGEYLIVYEEGNVAFNGSLTTLDAVSNTVAIEINNNIIVGNTEIDAATFTIDATEGTVKSASGNYIGVTSYGNGLKQSTDASTYGKHSFVISEGNAIVKLSNDSWDGDMILNYNSDANQTRFRYYKNGGQKDIALYKKVDPNEIIEPQFKLAAGEYYGTQSVEITCATADAKIYYTLNGTDPTSASTEYTGAISITSTTTIKAVAIKGENSSAVVSATYTILAPLATMQEIFDKATAVGGTATPVHITMNNWVVTGVKNNNVYVTDGTKGLIIYTASHGFNVGDILSGTVACKVQLYNGSSELTELTSETEGLNVTADGVVTPVVVSNVNTLGGVNTGSVIKITGPCTVDGTKYYVAGVQLYNSLYTYTNPEDGYNYECTGVYLQYNTTKEILPRKAEDLVKIETQQPAGIAFAVAELTAEVGATEFAEPELTNPNGLSVEYSTSDATLATVDATTGEVTIGNKAGKVTITASFAGSDDFVAADASYNITITDPSISTVTFDATIDKTPDAETLSLTKDVITMTFTGGAMNNGENYRCYKDQTLTISAIDASIQKIEFECTSSNPISGFADATGLDKTNSVWTGDAKSIELTASNKQVRMSKVNVYYKKDNRAETGLAWNPATVSLTVGDAFTAPTLSNPNNLTGITFASDNEALATVTNAGVISLVNGKTGTATITATYAGNETYKAAEITCVITVSPKSEKVVILAEYNGQWYALKNAEQTAGKVIAALPVNYVGGKLYNVADADKATIEWQLAIDGSIATFKNGENYIFGTEGDTNLKLSTTECEWTLEGSTYKIGNRTFIYRAQANGFKNYNATTTPGTDDYSNLPVVAAPVYATGDAYGRTVTTGEYGTICIPYGSSNYTGAEFYEISWMEMDGTTPKGIWLDQVNGALTAGKPYIFKATADEIAIVGDGTTATAPVAGVAGLVGTFALIQDIETSDPSNTLEGNYMISGNQFLLCPAGCWLNANRAYIDASIIAGHTTKKAEIPGRRRVCLGETSENEATGFENIVAPEGQAVKAIVNGQLIIIRDGVKYNVQGQKL